MTGAAYPDWDAIYRDNVTWVYRLIYGKVGNQPDAEDLTAEVFMTALRPLRVSATRARGAQIPADDGAHCPRVLLG